MRKIITYGILLIWGICITPGIVQAWQTYFVAGWTPVGAVSWKHVGEREWLYVRQDAQVGLGACITFPDMHLSTKQYVIVSDKVGIPAMGGYLAVNLQKGTVIVKYSYYYRWHTGSLDKYAYATGAGLAHQVKIELAIPLFGSKR